MAAADMLRHEPGCGQVTARIVNADRLPFARALIDWPKRRSRSA